MECILYINNSDARVFNKKLTEVLPQDAETPNIPINILEDSSIVDPYIVLSAPTNIIRANYMFIPDLGRYYYITDWILSKNRIYVKGHVDVLMSFRVAIKEVWAIMERQENNFDLYLNDSMISIENPNDVRTINFPGAFNDTSEFILIVAGDNTGGDEEDPENTGGDEIGI